MKIESYIDKGDTLVEQVNHGQSYIAFYGWKDRCWIEESNAVHFVVAVWRIKWKQS